MAARPRRGVHDRRPRRDRVLCGDYLTLEDGRRISWPSLVRGGSPQRHARLEPQHAEYAATMGPVVGLALADWLDAAAADAEQGEPDARALAVTRALAEGRPS
ncbi:hypothetical protein [Streptomyces sp. NPDC059786]|uniref:hypothetical protein n=1 Tax=Streptomyces sp. NPDC059786 TaxID=3346946 RepID=UPI00365FA772